PTCRGVMYTLSTSSLGALANTAIDVFAPDCSSIIASDDDGGGGLSSSLDWVAPADGMYRARVRQADGMAGGDRGYDLTCLRSGPGCDTWAGVYGVEGFVWTDEPSVASHSDGTVVVVNGQVDA